MSDYGVYKAIASIIGDMSEVGIGKNKKNQQQGFKFRGIDDVYNALSPLLAKYKLMILPRVLSREVSERKTAKGGTLFYVVCDCEFDFVCAEDGSKHTVRVFGEAMDSGDKATNKAMSIALKYAAFQTFFIPTEATAQDPDATVHQAAEAQLAPKQPLVYSPQLEQYVIGKVKNGEAIQMILNELSYQYTISAQVAHQLQQLGKEYTC